MDKEDETAVCGSLMIFSILDDWKAITGYHFSIGLQTTSHYNTLSVVH